MKKKRFQVGNDFFEIPDNEVSSFLSDNPKAVEVRYYDLNGSKYNIPISEADAFESEMGLKKKEPPTSITSLVGQSVGLAATSGGGGVGPSGEEKIDPNDPIKSALKPIQNKMAELRSLPVSESTAQSTALRQQQSIQKSELLRKKSELDNMRFGNAGEAEFFIKDKLDPSKLVLKGEIDITKQPTLDDYTEESIVAASPKDNVTVGVGINQYLNGRKIKEAVNSSATLDEAATKYALSQSNLVGKQVKELSGDIPNAMKAGVLVSMLNDPDFQDMVGRSADLQLKVSDAIRNFPRQYPKAAISVLSSAISNVREQRGDNGAILNLPGVKKNDEIVKELIESGQLPEQYGDFYNVPAIRFLVNRNLKTPGLVENLAGGLGAGLEGMGKSVAELTGARSLYKSKEEQLYQSLEKQYEDFTFKPKGILHNITTHGGSIVGQVLPVAIGGNYLLASKLVTNPTVANSIMIWLQSFGYNKEKALADLPDESEATQLGYATLNTAIEVGTEMIVNDTRLARNLVKKVSPQIKDVIKRFTVKDITETQAKNEVSSLVLRAISNLPRFTKGVAKVSIGEANEEGLASILQSASNQVFGGEPISFRQAANDAFDVWKTTAMGAPLLGIGGGVVAVRNKPTMGELVYEMAGNKDYYEEIIRGQAAIDPEYGRDVEKKIENLNHAASVREVLDQSNLNDAQKRRLVLISLQQKNLETDVKKSPDKDLMRVHDKEIRSLNIEKNAVLEDSGVQKQVEEFYNEGLLGKGSMEDLSKRDEEGHPTKEFDPSKVGKYLKQIAQQANNLDENWQPHKGDPPSMSDVPSYIIELANERWSKEVESSKQKFEIDQDIDLMDEETTTTQPEGQIPTVGEKIIDVDAEEKRFRSEGAELWEVPHKGDMGGVKTGDLGVTDKGEMGTAFNMMEVQPKIIEDALNNGQYEKAIKEGRMSATYAKKIIESAELEVPQDILIDAGLEKTETPAPTTETKPSTTTVSGEAKPESKTKVKSKEEIVSELEAKRDAEILEKGKPEVNLVFVSAKELVNSKDPIGNKKIHNDIKDRYKELKSLIDCLWGKNN